MLGQVIYAYELDGVGLDKLAIAVQAANLLVLAWMVGVGVCRLMVVPRPSIDGSKTLRFVVVFVVYTSFVLNVLEPHCLSRMVYAARRTRNTISEVGGGRYAWVEPRGTG